MVPICVYPRPWEAGGHRFQFLLSHSWQCGLKQVTSPLWGQVSTSVEWGSQVVFACPFRWLWKSSLMTEVVEELFFSIYNYIFILICIRKRSHQNHDFIALTVCDAARAEKTSWDSVRTPGSPVVPLRQLRHSSQSSGKSARRAVGWKYFIRRSGKGLILFFYEAHFCFLFF